jgi:hypothetical protein
MVSIRRDFLRDSERLGYHYIIRFSHVDELTRRQTLEDRAYLRTFKFGDIEVVVMGWETKCLQVKDRTRPRSSGNVMSEGKIRPIWAIWETTPNWL